MDIIDTFKKISAEVGDLNGINNESGPASKIKTEIHFTRYGLGINTISGVGSSAAQTKQVIMWDDIKRCNGDPGDLILNIIKTQRALFTVPVGG